MEESSYFPGSSYYIYEAQKGIGEGIPRDSRTVTYYDCDGEPLGTMEHHFYFPGVEAILDCKAPKIRPATFAIETECPAIRVGSGFKKGEKGKFVVFYDKNNNRLAMYRYDVKRSSCQMIVVF